ncbi:hypothetical protein EMIHUDRAFT_44050, partial [Emiliania huxleyi CCMP1516]|uniref:SMP-30/Gluconolactonase/LRE-like region domain-containing protein n=2 Tax=Emiliania huxleyi TaxID=2903 RepID=A0A0D3K904_EMIH1
GPTGIDALDDGCKVVCSQHRIMKVAPDGTVTTLAGSGSATFADGQGAAAHFHNPEDVAVDMLDMYGFVYVADQSNHRIRKIAPDGTVTTLAGSGNAAFADGQGIAAHFHHPAGVAVDGDGCVYVADQSNHRIRKIAPDGTVTTLAGSGSATFADGQGIAAHFHTPTGAAVDGDGCVYVADQSNHRIRKIAPDGTVTTLAGSGNAGSIEGQG